MPVAVRDLAIIELLYASALRVSELTGLAVRDVDLGRLTVRVLGKGSKERVVPFGQPARVALERYLGTARHELAGDTDAVFVGARGGRMSARSVYELVSGILASVPGTGPAGPAHLPPHRGDAPARRRGGPPRGAGAARPREPRHHPAVHARVVRAPQGELPPGPPARVGTQASDDARRARTGLPIGIAQRVGSRIARGIPPRNRSGDTYWPSTRTPRCTQVDAQCPGSTVPITSPRVTESPSTSDVSTGS